MEGTHNDGWTPNERARLAVAAVLETLAGYMGPRFNTIGIADIRHLAAEVKNQEDK